MRRTGLPALAILGLLPLSGCVAVAPLFMAGAAGCGVSGECQGTPQPTLQSRLTGEDAAAANVATQHALEQLRDGQSAYWDNPLSGAGGSVTPLVSYKVSAPGDFTHCRDYRGIVRQGAESMTYEDRACRNGRGAWIRVSKV